MKYLFIAFLAICLIPEYSFAQSNDDKSEELKELKEEIKALKDEMKSGADKESDDASAEEQDAELEALKQELKAMKSDMKDDKKAKKKMADLDLDEGEEMEYTYTVPEQQIIADEKAMSLGVEPCHLLVVRDMKDKDVKNRWKDYMKKYDAKAQKVKGSKHEQKFENVTIYDLGYGKYNIHSTVYKTGADSELVVWVNDGDGFISSDSEKAPGVQKYLEEFGIYIEKYKVEKEMEKEAKILKKHNERQEKLVKEKNKLENNIAKWEKEIVEAKAEIERNIVDQQNNAIEVKNQEAVVKMVQNKISKF